MTKAASNSSNTTTPLARFVSVCSHSAADGGNRWIWKYEACHTWLYFGAWPRPQIPRETSRKERRLPEEQIEYVIWWLHACRPAFNLLSGIPNRWEMAVVLRHWTSSKQMGHGSGSPTPDQLHRPRTPGLVFCLLNYNWNTHDPILSYSDGRCMWMQLLVYMNSDR
jgi:hypothetical protein